MIRGETMVNRVKGLLMKVLVQRLHMRCGIFVFIHNLKICNFYTNFLLCVKYTICLLHLHPISCVLHIHALYHIKFEYLFVKTKSSKFRIFKAKNIFKPNVLKFVVKTYFFQFQFFSFF
jgi:hypothetical protein